MNNPILLAATAVALLALPVSALCLGNVIRYEYDRDANGCAKYAVYSDCREFIMYVHPSFCGGQS